ncbi:MAG: hypothetical protein ACE148_16945 [Vicinamibacterales bacterium]
MRTTSFVPGTGIALLTAAALALVACSDGHPVKPTGGLAARPPYPKASPGAQGLNSGLARIRAATARFHDLEAAAAAGYVLPPGSPCVASPAGTMGFHYVNEALLTDPAIDPLEPEILVYAPKEGGGLRLVAVEYMAIALVSNGSAPPQPWFPQERWSPSWSLVNTAPSVLGRTFDGPMAGHEPGMPWHWDLHAWVWAPNPSGEFAQFNPSLSCAP